jgi:two-component system, OmpR family, sensor histidine kinase CreC
MRISLKLLAGYFLIVGLAAYFVMRIFVTEIKPSVRVTIEENMVDMANMLAELAAPEMPLAEGNTQSSVTSPAFAERRFAKAINQFTKREVKAKIWNHDKEALDLRVYVTDHKGIVLYDSSGTDLGKDYSAWRDVYLTLKGQYGARSTREIPGDDKTAIYHVAAPIKRDQDIIGVLTVAKPISSVSPIIDQAESSILNKGVWLVLGSLVIGLWVSVRLQRSVGRLVGFAEALSQGELAPRPTSSTKELQQLASSIEKLRGQVDGKAYVERYVQALTHELKSPLTALQAHAELLAEDNKGAGQSSNVGAHSATRILEQTLRIRSLVDQMLVLARLEGGQIPALERQNWSILLKALTEQHQEAAKLRGIALRFDPPEGAAWVSADEPLLRLACSNLIQNALEFSAQGASVECWLEAAAVAWVFKVRDHGTGLSELAKIKLFERYFSTPRPSTGARSSGLGLALSREIVYVHKGSLSIDSAEPGVLASLSLPRLQSTQATHSIDLPH